MSIAKIKFELNNGLGAQELGLTYKFYLSFWGN